MCMALTESNIMTLQLTFNDILPNPSTLYTSVDYVREIGNKYDINILRQVFACVHQHLNCESDSTTIAVMFGDYMNLQYFRRALLSQLNRYNIDNIDYVCVTTFCITIQNVKIVLCTTSVELRGRTLSNILCTYDWFNDDVKMKDLMTIVSPENLQSIQ